MERLYDLLLDGYLLAIRNPDEQMRQWIHRVRRAIPDEFFRAKLDGQTPDEILPSIY